MKREKRITYQAGITTSPSDFLCQDGELAECINLTTDGEELKVVSNLSVKESRYKKRLIFVHRMPNGKEQYIYEEGEELFTVLPDGFLQIESSNHKLSVNANQIRAIGNILSVVLDGAPRHFLWEGDYYKMVGNMPSLEIRPELTKPSTPYMTAQADGSGTIYNINDIRMAVGKGDEYKTLMTGLYAETLTKIHQAKGFAKPFFVRAALELQDGTYTMISNPVLMWPTIRGCTVFSTSTHNYYITCQTAYSNLIITQKEDYSGYSDMVKDVVIFISDGIDVYDTVSKQSNGVDCKNSINGNTYNIGKGVVKNSNGRMLMYNYVENSEKDVYYAKVLKEREQQEIVSDIVGTSIFYKLCSIGLKPVINMRVADKIDTHTLENLVNRTRLNVDDYYSRCPMTANFLFDYNSRLNMSGVKRGFFEGFHCFMPIAIDYDNEVYDYKIFVRIKTAEGKKTVKTTISNTTDLIKPYFYYPDSRADRVTVWKIAKYETEYSVVLNTDLKECNGLNGAYFFDEDWVTTQDSYGSYNDGKTALRDDDAVGTTPESLGSQLLQSSPNNPFTFPSTGYIQVGKGDIIGMASVTMALSQEQFGRTDLIVFTDAGIWGLQVDNTGIYSEVHPLSREVALVDNPCIVQTDNAVFFASKKGLMVIDENGRVACVSERLNGKIFYTSLIRELREETLDAAIGGDSDMWAWTVGACNDASSFRTFLIQPHVFMAYDYQESRLLIINGGDQLNYCWVYSLKDGTFSKMTLERCIIGGVNAYPDFLLQDVNMNVYSLYDKKPEEDVTDRRRAFLLTRPMKLSGPLTVTSLRELVNVGVWDESSGSTVKTEVFVSDNLRNWYLSGSRFGAAAKYFRLALFIEMLPSERLSGTIIMEEERRTENLRVDNISR